MPTKSPMTHQTMGRESDERRKMAEEISGSKIKGSAPGVNLGTHPCNEASGAWQPEQQKTMEWAYVGNGLR